MKFIKLKDFCSLERKPFLVGSFLSRTKEENINNNMYFFTYTNFRSSKYVFKNDFNLLNYANELEKKFNNVSGYENWEIYKGKTNSNQIEIRFYIKNDMNMSAELFYKMLMNYLNQEEWTYDSSLNESKKNFLRGFFENRGSIDIKRKYITQDYFYNNNTELMKAQMLIDKIPIPYSYSNLNLRELQPDYINNINKRNTQFRIYLNYYAKEIGFINEYKAKIFENSYKLKPVMLDDIFYFNCELKDPSFTNTQLCQYLQFYRNKIYKQSLTKQIVEEYRNELKLDSKKSNNIKRDSLIVKTYRDITDDKCELCGKDKTFKSAENGKQFFEIHHMISLANNSELDNINNLVKLCPDCHRLLSKGKASYEDQIDAIKKLLKNNLPTLNFAANYFGLETSQIDEIAIEIQKRLK